MIGTLNVQNNYKRKYSLQVMHMDVCVKPGEVNPAGMEILKPLKRNRGLNKYKCSI